MLLHLAMSIMLLASVFGAPVAGDVPARTPVRCWNDYFSFDQEPLLVTTAEGRLFAATAEGWRELFPPAGWHQVEATPDGSIYVYGNYGYIWRSADGGVSWQPHGRTISSTAWGVLYPSPDPDLLLLVTKTESPYGDRLWRSIDAGETWTEQISRGGDIRNVVFSPDFAHDATVLLALDGYVIESGVYKSTDGGATWDFSGEGLALGVHASQVGLALAPAFPQDGVAFAGSGSTLSDEGGFFKSSNGAAAWQKMNDAHTGGSPALSPRYAVDKTLVVPGWRSNRLFLSQDDGATLATIWEGADWSLIAWGVTMPHTLGAAPVRTAAGQYRLYLPLLATDAVTPELWLVAQETSPGPCYLHRSRDLGASWQEVSLPE